MASGGDSFKGGFDRRLGEGYFHLLSNSGTVGVFRAIPSAQVLGLLQGSSGYTAIIYLGLSLHQALHM